MKKTLILLLSSLTVVALPAQITITQNDLPEIGYTYVTYTDTTPSITLGNPSASAQTWNFSSLGQDYPSVPTYGATSWTAYQSAFPASNMYTYGPAALYSSLAGGAPVGSQGMNKGYMFWKTDATGFYTVGFRADSGTYSNVNVQVSPNELLIGTPATYNTVFNNTSAWTFPMNINPADYDTFYTSRTVKTLTTDAWGDITTPTGYYPAVIRIHEHLVKVDSVYIRFNNVLIYSQEFLRDTANNYLFMANNLHYPVSIVHADAQNAVKSVEYYSATYTSIPEPDAQQSSVYPNPCNEYAYITLPGAFNGNAVQVSIYDCTMRLISISEMTYASQVVLPVGDMENGMYTYIITGQNGVRTTGKLQIIH